MPMVRLAIARVLTSTPRRLSLSCALTLVSGFLGTGFGQWAVLTFNSFARRPRSGADRMQVAEEFWQDFAEDLPGGDFALLDEAYPAQLATGRTLLLPIRTLPDGHHGLASLIINQASFLVQNELCRLLAEQLRPLAPEVVVGLPTLGLTVASAVAQMLGHSRYLPLGTSRKFWYDERYSASISSVTTAETRRLYIDPRLLPLLVRKRVALIDDVLSTGRSITGGLALLRQLGVEPVAIGAVMLQTNRWVGALGEQAPPVVGVFRTPLLQRHGDGWLSVSGG
jgi:adenine/guanine phosphoribosyltransferase-like PRPP-binding protein